MRPFNHNILLEKEGEVRHNKVGYIYIMKNDSSLENRYKVGLTKRDPKIRAKELSTSYADDFIVLYFRKTKDMYKTEKKIFNLLKDNMPNGRKEVVDVFDVNMIKDVIDYVIDTEEVF